MKLYPQQLVFRQKIYDAWAAGHRNVAACAPCGSGKCLAKGTPVLMYDGSIRAVETIGHNDLLMGPDSTPRRVLSIARGNEMMYRVTPVKGDSYTVNESHILSLKETATKKIVNISIKEYISRSQNFKNTHKGWRTAIDFPSRPENFPITPYMLGVWLGDGGTGKPLVTTRDPEIIAECVAWSELMGLRFRIEYNSENSVNVHIVGDRGHQNKFSDALRWFNVFDHKNVPECIKYGSRETRLGFLAGILDTDGHHCRGCYDFVQKDEKTVDDVIFIARSLGLAAYKVKIKKQCTNNGVWGEYFRCTISGETSRIPCKVARNIAAPRRQKKDVLHTGITVEPIGVDEYYGFEIDGDRLFVLGDFTVTHNTVVFCSVLLDNDAPAVAIAHRQELVGQMSCTLARNGVKHRLIAPGSLQKAICRMHMLDTGRVWVDPNARVAVAGVLTLANRAEELKSFLARVGLWVIDEGHHLLRENQWGKAVSLMPNARGLAVSATFVRADGKGLGRHADGVLDTIVYSESMKWHIDNGYLTDYKIYCPPSDMNFSGVKPGATGDYNHKQLRAIAKTSHIVGDVVKHYQKIAPGKLGVTFAPDIETGEEITASYNDADIPAALITANTPDDERRTILNAFRHRNLLQLVNVDLFGEGFDLPAVEVVTMARRTESLSLFMQQMARSGRVMVDDPREWGALTSQQRLDAIAASNKPRAIIIDHVGNFIHHRAPEYHKVWSLDRRESRSSNKDPDVIPLTTCRNEGCFQPYEKHLPECPYCGFKPVPARRDGPEFVDGDLTELDPAVLAMLRGEIDRIDEPPVFPVNATPIVQGAIKKNHKARQDAQAVLRQAIAVWGATWRARGVVDSASYRLFYLTYGIDVLSAQALGAREALELLNRLTDSSTSTNLTVTDEE